LLLIAYCHVITQTIGKLPVLEAGKEIKPEKVNDEIHQLVAILFIFSLTKKTAAEGWL